MERVPKMEGIYPRALEVAEVFSGGRTMWMLLEQVPQSELEDVDGLIVSWSEDAKDIPEDWKAVVSRCLRAHSNAMAISVLPHAVEHYNSLPEVHVAKYQNCNIVRGGTNSKTAKL